MVLFPGRTKALTVLSVVKETGMPFVAGREAGVEPGRKADRAAGREVAKGVALAGCEAGWPELTAVGRPIARVRYTGTFNIVFIYT